MDELRGISQDEFVEVEDRPIQNIDDNERPARTRTLTEKGAAYKIEILRRRDEAYSELRLKQIKTLCSLLASDVTLEEFEAERNAIQSKRPQVKTSPTLRSQNVPRPKSRQVKTLQAKNP